MEDLSENINEKINSIGNITENISIKNRQEKIITRKGIIITCILLFFVSIFLDLYFIYISKVKLFMKIILCIIHPLLFVIFSFIPSGLYIEFNYEEKKFKYYKTCIIPYIWNKCTKNEIENIKEFIIDTSKFLWFNRFTLYYLNNENDKIKIISGRDKNCRKDFSKEVLNIPVKLNFWLKNEDFSEQETVSQDKSNDNNEI